MLLSLHSLSSTVPAFLNQHQTGSLVTVQKKLWLERRRPLPTKGDRSNEEEAVRHALVVEELKQERSELMLRLTKVGGGLSWDPEKVHWPNGDCSLCFCPNAQTNQPNPNHPLPCSVLAMQGFADLGCSVHWMRPGFLWAGTLNDWMIAVLGIISSGCALQQTYLEHRQLCVDSAN